MRYLILFHKILESLKVQYFLILKLFWKSRLTYFMPKYFQCERNYWHYQSPRQQLERSWKMIKVDSCRSLLDEFEIEIFHVHLRWRPKLNQACRLKNFQLSIELVHQITVFREIKYDRRDLKIFLDKLKIIWEMADMQMKQEMNRPCRYCKEIPYNLVGCCTEPVRV